MSRSPSSTPANTTLDGRWALIKPIGEGGMGAVWLARDLQLDRQVAVKILSEQHSQQKEFVDRFVREAQLLSRLNHPNIVTLFGVGRDGGRPFLVMRFLKGTPLLDLMKGPIALETTLPLLKQLCAGLAAMHNHGILHRDIKPANILVSETGHLTLLDLGIARPGDSSLTKTGVVFGTVGYMSPEQMLGEKTLDGRSDLYSVAVLAYQMLSGRMPFSDTDDYVNLFKAMRNVQPDLSRHRPDLPKKLGAVLEKGLAFDAADRYAGMADFWIALEEAGKERVRAGAPAAKAPELTVSHSGARTERYPPPPRQPAKAAAEPVAATEKYIAPTAQVKRLARAPRSRRALWIALAAGALALAGGAAALLLR